MAIAFFKAPTKLSVPAALVEGPNKICSKVPLTPNSTTCPRGKSWCTASDPQCFPPPGALLDLARAEPIITASAPMAIALLMSPLLPTEPSAITCTYLPSDSSKYSLRAAATSATAVAIGTRTPRTSALVCAAPPPNPTNTPAAPVLIKCKPA